jgi:hypothetical protein
VLERPVSLKGPFLGILVADCVAEIVMTVVALVVVRVNAAGTKAQVYLAGRPLQERSTVPVNAF